jgi:DNA-binding GntR family transcriptional regulator
MIAGLDAPRARLSLRDEAIQTLHAAIIAGEMRPGLVYSAPALAAQLQMSATPVREAMLDLVKEGLVVAVRNKGFRVVELSDTELDDLTELRMLLEPPSIRKLAERGLNAAERDQISGVVARIEQAADDGDMVAYNRADLEFHLGLLGLLGNAALVATVRSLRVRSRLYGLSALADSGALFPSSHEHRELFECVTAARAGDAEALMQQHIGHVRGAWATGTQADQAYPHAIGGARPHART